MRPPIPPRPPPRARQASRALLVAIFAVASAFFETPTEAGVAVLGSLARDTAVEPGELFEGAIELKNTGNSSQDVRLYQTDYVFAADGSNRYDPVGSHSRSNGLWLAVTPSIVTVPSGQTVVARYRGKVPSDPGLSGTYWSAIMVEPQVSAEQSVSSGKEVQASLRTVVRYAIQVVTEVGPKRERKVRFQDKRIVEADGKRLLQVDVENTGEAFLAPTLWAEFYDSAGQRRSRLQAFAKRLFPGCSVRHVLDLSGLPADRYRVLLVLDNGDESVFGAQYTLNLGK